MDAMDTVQTFVLVVLLVLAGLLKKRLDAYSGSFGSEEGKIDAIHENLAKVLEHEERQTTAVEQIKAQTVGGLWVAQERWKLKRDVYLPLIEHHSRIADCLRRGAYMREPGGRFNRYVQLRREIDGDPKFMQARALAPLALGPSMLRLLRDVEDQLGELERDEKLWEGAALEPNTARFQYKALALMGYDDVSQEFASAGGKDLGSFSEPDRVAFEADQREREQVGRIFDAVRENRQVPREDSAALEVMVERWRRVLADVAEGGREPEQ